MLVMLWLREILASHPSAKARMDGAPRMVLWVGHPPVSRFFARAEHPFCFRPAMAPRRTGHADRLNL